MRAGPGRDPAPGERAVSRGRTVTEADVVQFAALTGDMHPQHTDAAWAARGRFGERVAHGMLVLSYCAGLVDFDPDRVVALRGISRATFKAPVRLGDTIHVESTVEALDPIDAGHARLTCGWRVVDQDGRLVARARVELVWRLAAAGEAAAAGPAAADAPAAGEYVPIPL